MQRVILRSQSLTQSLPSSKEIVIVSRCLFTLASPPLPLAPVIAQTGQTVKQDMLTIHEAARALDKTTQSYYGTTLPTSLVMGTPVLARVTKIHTVSCEGFAHALGAPPFKPVDSAQIIDTVVRSVNVSISTACEHIKEKHNEFDKRRLVPSVIGTLTLLLSDQDSFSSVVISKLDSGIGATKRRQGVDAVYNIHNAVQDAIMKYTTRAV